MIIKMIPKPKITFRPISILSVFQNYFMDSFGTYIHFEPILTKDIPFLSFQFSKKTDFEFFSKEVCIMRNTNKKFKMSLIKINPGS